MCVCACMFFPRNNIVLKFCYEAVKNSTSYPTFHLNRSNQHASSLKHAEGVKREGNLSGHEGGAGIC